MVFHSAFNHYYSVFNDTVDKPHFIISSIEHDSVKLVAENFMIKNIEGILINNINIYFFL
jgi:hypothetical protein